MLPSVGQGGEKLEPSPPSLVGTHNGTALWNTGWRCLRRSGKLTVTLGSCIPGSPPERKENVCLHKRLYVIAHDYTIHENQVETTKYLLTEKWIQPNGVHPYKGVFIIQPQKGKKP